MSANVIRRISEEQLEQLVGREAVELRTARHRGGTAAARGYDYEQLFITHRVARLLMKLETTGIDATLEAQANEFVDDVVVRRDSDRCVKAYQLKNTSSVSWSAEDAAISRDFQLQAAVCEHEGYTRTRLRLVCSDKNRVAALVETLPPAISGTSKPIYFPHGEKWQSLIDEHSWMRDDFAFLSRKAEPSHMDCAEVASVITGAWALLKPVASVRGVFEQARKTSPTVLRPLETGEDAASRVRAEVREILDRIPGFNYAIVRGFLTWSLNPGATSGILKFDCFDPEFDRLQDEILQRNPATFEEIEELL
jgi:hypothetical protein